MHTQNAQANAVSEINVTPLIDVMLCLLIIFMIAAPTLTQIVPLDLPQPPLTPPPEPVKPEPPIQVRILADGRLLLDQRPISAPVLSVELAYQAARDKRRILAVDADQDARYEQVLEVLADARDQGITRIAMHDGTLITP
ncbi:MAG: biopolymer transporter ExbD [Pseudomonadota bacterium]|nr:biopolymer transporter ExbD [Pseudomonadota bacterium]